VKALTWEEGHDQRVRKGWEMTELLAGSQPSTTLGRENPVWYRTLSLTEPLTSQERANGSVTAGGQRKLQQWSEPSSCNKAADCMQRLATDRLTEEALLHLVSEPIAAGQHRTNSAPPWLVRFWTAFEEVDLGLQVSLPAPNTLLASVDLRKVLLRPALQQRQEDLDKLARADARFPLARLRLEVRQAGISDRTGAVAHGACRKYRARTLPYGAARQRRIPQSDSQAGIYKLYNTESIRSNIYNIEVIACSPTASSIMLAHRHGQAGKHAFWPGAARTPGGADKEEQ